jgi:hypothetical protein
MYDLNLYIFTSIPIKSRQGNDERIVHIKNNKVKSNYKMIK